MGTTPAPTWSWAKPGPGTRADVFGRQQRACLVTMSFLFWALPVHPQPYPRPAPR